MSGNDGQKEPHRILRIPSEPPEEEKIFYNTPKTKRRKKNSTAGKVTGEEFDAYLVKAHRQCRQRIAYHAKKLIAAADNVEAKRKTDAKPKTRAIAGKAEVTKTANPETTMFKGYICGYKTKPSKIRKRKLEGTISKKEFLARSKKMIKEIRERKHPPTNDQDIAHDKKI